MSGKARWKYLLIGVIWVSMIAVLSACSAAEESGADEQGVSSQVVETVEEETPEVQEPAQETVEVATEEVVEEPAGEVVEDTFEDVFEWAEAVDKAEPKLTIWNEITKEGTILENEQEYCVKEGDKLVICFEGEDSHLGCDSLIIEPEKFEDNFKLFKFVEMPTEPTPIRISQVLDGVEYVYKVTFVSEDSAMLSEGNNSEQISGKEWAASLGYDYPKLLVWNDEQGIKVEIEEGQEYELQPGDVLAVYNPENYIPQKVEPENFLETFIFNEGYTILKYVVPEGGSSINFVLKGWLGEEESKLTCTLILPIE